jgi:hypothetical protein
MENDDHPARTLAKKYKAFHTDRIIPLAGAAYGWNSALLYAMDYDAYFIGADDISFTANWLEYVLEELDRIGGDGLIGINDTRRDAVKIGRASHYLMTRKFIIKHHGGVAAIPHYRSEYTDVESCERAQRVNLYGYADRAIVPHHWLGNEPTADRCYKINRERKEEARRIFNQRKDAGYPDDFEPILK